MKKIIIIICLLLAAIVTMAYLYFSKLNASRHSTDSGLRAAAATSGFIFSFENQKEITDILKEQVFFNEVLGKEKYKQLSGIKNQLLFLPAVNQETENQYIYIAFVAGQRQETEFICFTQIQDQANTPKLLQAIKMSGVKVERLGNINKLILKDSTECYLSIRKNLVVLSPSLQQVTTFLAKKSQDKSNKFADFIRTGTKLSKNSLAQLYLNFNTIPLLLKNMSLGNLKTELNVIKNQDAFASLTYNYSKDKVLFTGTTVANDPDNYYQLFSDLQALKTTIHNLLPVSTSSYTIFAIDNYQLWRKKLSSWMEERKEPGKTSELIKMVDEKYHLNLDEVLPRYFKDQMLTFKMGDTEKVGAINLTNGDKLSQLLLDLSDDYDEEIKVMKEEGLLYAYFGLPFEHFKKPFYVVMDNYMIFANHPATLRKFLTSYKNDQLLIHESHYINASNQLPGNSNISIYLAHKNSTDLLKKYDSFTCQLSGDNGKFQTNILINKQEEVSQKDSLAL